MYLNICIDRSRCTTTDSKCGHLQFNQLIFTFDMTHLWRIYNSISCPDSEMLTSRWIQKHTLESLICRWFSVNFRRGREHVISKLEKSKKRNSRYILDQYSINMYRSTINQLLLYSLEDFELQVSVYNKTNSKLIVYLSHFTPKSLAKVNFSLRYMQRVVVPASVVTPGDGASKYVTYFPRNRSARSLSFMSMVWWSTWLRKK